MDWKKKVGSRKLWAAITSVAICVLVLFNVDQLTIEKVVALIGAVGTLLGYIFAEAYIDSKAVNK